MINIQNIAKLQAQKRDRTVPIAGAKNHPSVHGQLQRKINRDPETQRKKQQAFTKYETNRKAGIHKAKHEQGPDTEGGGGGSDVAKQSGLQFSGEQRGGGSGNANPKKRATRAKSS